MEYVADELGVSVLKLPALQRELSLRADVAAIRQLRAILRRAQARRAAHAHLEGRRHRANRRAPVRLAPDRAPSSTPTTGTS